MKHKETDMYNYNNFDKDNIISINGNDDPFGINDVLLEMIELLDEKYDLVAEEATDAPILIDFTSLSDEEMSELIKEAVACVEFENEFMACEGYIGKRQHLLS